MKDRIDDHINSIISAQNLIKAEASDSILKAAEAIAHCLLNDRKVISCGNGIAVTIAQHFAALMIGKVNYERPSLPAVSICSGITEIFGITDDFNYDVIFARQIQAVGQSDDILLVCSILGNGAEIIEAIRAAHDRGINVILLTSNNDAEAVTHLLAEDIAIIVPTNNSNTSYEIQITITHCISMLIDAFLFNL